MRLRTYAVIATLALAPLSACGADTAAENLAEKAVEDALEQEGVEADIDVDSGEVKIESSDGTFEAGTGDLPDDFPIDAGDLVDGEILSSVSVADGFSVTIESSATAEEAAALLEDAGYTSEDSGMADMALLDNGTYQVIIQAIDGNVTYTIGLV